MKWLSLLCLLLTSFLFLRCVFCQRTSVCDTYVKRNAVTVNDQIVEDIEASRASFQDVVDCLERGGIIQFATATFSVDETIRLEKDIAITSTHRRKTSFACNQQPVFDIRGRATVDLSGIRIRECELQSADAPIIIDSGSTVIFRSTEFFRNTNGEGSSGIKALDESSIIIEDCEFLENRGASGTVVLENASSLTVSGSNFTGNNATSTENGGGVFSIQSEGVSTTVVVKNASTFIKNEAVGDGGAFYVSGDDGITFTIEDTVLRENVAGRRGGAVFISTGGNLTVRDAFFVENESNRTGGGAIFAEDAEGNELLDIKISNTIFAQNEAKGYLGSGGGIRLQGKNVSCTITDSVSFTLNTADLDGGGMHISNQATADINGSSFVGNEASNGGGAALFILSSQQNRAVTMDVVITDTTFLFNQALYTDRGGGCIGVAGFGSNVTVTDCIFSDNDGGMGAGGAIYVFGGPVVKIMGSAFERNKAEWGGALYAENDALYEIKSSTFVENAAGEGGAIHTRGDVDVAIDNCKFEENKAMIEGGAVKVRNYASAENELARFRIRNSTIVDNGAGINLSEERLFGTETQGGGILAEGSGVELELVNNMFNSNVASNGGALSIFVVADCNIDGGNRFEGNNATFGAGIRLVVDEQVKPGRDIYRIANADIYRIANAVFRGNRVEFEGGAIFVSSTRAEFNSVSLNAEAFLLQVENSMFENNEARRGGGALSAIGSAARIHGCVFKSNTAVANSASQSTPFVGYGGAMNIQTGSSIECKNSTFESNKANVGGAAFVRDASLFVINTNFTQNAVLSRGVGGAVAMEISKGQDVPVLNSVNRSSNIIFQCDVCDFQGNNGSLAGGALHVHDMDPGGTYGEDNELKINGCTEKNQNTYWTPKNELRCSTYLSFLKRVNARSIRLRNTTFTANRARAGGAIFTNNLTMISILPDLQGNLNEDIDNSLGYALTKNKSQLLNSSVFFEKNVAVNNGYGDDAASTPFVASLLELDDEEHLKRDSITKSLFLSGDRLQFNVEFTDGIEHLVTYAGLLTAHINCDEDRTKKRGSGCDQLEITGQEIAQVNEDGTMSFTDIRLKGLKGQTYILRVDYSAVLELQTLDVKPSFIIVTMRPCMVGETTVVRDDPYLACQECSSSTYNLDPDGTECKPCPENARCESRVITPDDGYWHASPCSEHIQGCLTSHACAFEGRSENLRNITESMISCDVDSAKIDEYQQAQCGKGHTGPLCGSCQSDYGTSLSSECTKCPSPVGNIAIISVSVLVLIVLSGITIRGMLGTTTKRPAMLGGRGRFLRSIHQFDSHSSNSEEAKETQEFNKRSNDSTEDRRIEGLPTTESNLARWKAVEMMKISLSYIQVTVLIASLNVGWPLFFVIIAEAAEFIGGLASESVRRSVVCLSTEDSFLHPTASAFIVVVCVIPCIAFLLLALFWTTLALFYCIERPVQYLAKRLLLSVMVLWYISAVAVIKTTLSMGLCVSVYNIVPAASNVEKISYWAVDTGLQCFRGDHLTLVILILAFVVIVYAGLLGFFIWALRFSKNSRADTTSWVYETTGFLYRSYRLGSCQYWEVVVLIRKATIAFLVFCAHRFNGHLPIAGLAAFISLAMGMQIVVMPYRRRFDDLNSMDSASLFVSLLTTLAASALRSEGFEDEVWGRTVITVACVVLNALTFAVLLLSLLTHFVDYLKLCLSEEGRPVDLGAGVLQVIKVWLSIELQQLFCFVGLDNPDDASNLSDGI